MVRFGIFPIHGHLCWRVSRIIDLQAINGNLPSELIEQLCIIAGISFTPSRMSDETHCPTSMSRINHCRKFVGSPQETSLRDQCSCRGFSDSVAQFF